MFHNLINFPNLNFVSMAEKNSQLDASKIMRHDE